MEPPVRTDSETIRDEKVKVLKAIPPLEPKNLVRAQFRDYHKEHGVAPDLRGDSVERRFLALARRAVLYPGRKVTAGNVYGNRRPFALAA